jgi:hypothetical protein
MQARNNQSQNICIELLGDPENERMTDIRKIIRESMTEHGMLPEWKERYMNQPTAIYINKKKVWTSEGSAHLPDRADVAKQITNGNVDSKRYRISLAVKKQLAFVFTLLIAFFPKCPLCWAAYISALGIFKANTISYQPWMLPVLIVLMILNICSLYMTGRRHHWKPFMLSIAGAAIIVTNRIFFDSTALIYFGSLMPAVAALWNTLTPKMTTSLSRYYIKRSPQWKRK